MKMINARVETVADRPAFRAPFERFRCLIIADGFYEWQAAGAGRPSGGKQAFHITRSDGGPFAFAGLWSIWRGDHSKLRSCAILTTAANEAVAPLHDRMPVILDGDVEEAWLDPSTPREQLIELIAPQPPSLTALRAVGPSVNDARYDGPECLAPAGESAQATLF
jgi:putative SOS response-associated peptidase YedK